jgi:hypothetical protein
MNKLVVAVAALAAASAMVATTSLGRGTPEAAVAPAA